MGCIYKATNTYNHKAYIGQTRHDAYKTRIKDHFAGRGSRLVKQAVDKYGKDAFIVEILYDGILPEFLDTLEIEAIAKYNTLAPNGYNLTTGGGGGMRSEETRRKISASKKGEKHPMYGKSFSEKHRRKLSEAQKGEKNHRYGKTHSEESKRKMSEALKGRTLLEETRRKISEAHKGRTHTDAHRRKNAAANKGRTSPMLGKKASDETRRKMSEAQKGEKNHNFGKKASDETRRKMSEAHKGKPLSEEHRRKISAARETPDRIAARKKFFSLPIDMSLMEKRKILRQAFPKILSDKIRRWCQKFDSET